MCPRTVATNDKWCWFLRRGKKYSVKQIPLIQSLSHLCFYIFYHYQISSCFFIVKMCLNMFNLTYISKKYAVNIRVNFLRIACLIKHCRDLPLILKMHSKKNVSIYTYNESNDLLLRRFSFSATNTPDENNFKRSMMLCACLIF